MGKRSVGIKPQKILLVEDDRDIVSFIETSLGSNDRYDVMCVSSGYEAMISMDEFRADCLHNAPTTEEGPTKGLGAIDFWVLVDGRICYQNLSISQSEETYPVQIDLSDKDSFLTLIVTDGSANKSTGDWGFFVKPELIYRDN